MSKLNKKQKKNFMIGVVIVSIILIFLLASGKIKSPFVTIPFCPGETGTISSISRTTFDSRHSLFQGPAWIAEFRSLPSGQCLYGSFSADEISDGKNKATHGFAVDIISDTQSCGYNIQRTKDLWRLVEVTRFFEKEADAKAFVEQMWKENNYEQIMKPKLIETGTWIDWEGYVFAFRKDYTGESIGVLKEPIVTWGVTFIFEDKKNNMQYSKKITSETSRSEWISDGKVRATWSGNLLGERWCPSETNVGAYQLKGGNWVLTNPNLESSFNNVISTWRSCIASASTTTSASACNRRFNEDFNKLDDQKTFCSSQVGECAKIVGNKAVITTNQPLLIPSFTLFIKADILGIYQSVGVPKITKIEKQDLVSDKSARIDVTGKNDGDDIGSFDMWIECPNPFNIITPTNTFSLSPSGERTIPFTISGSSIDDVLKTCCAYMKERATGEQVKECFTMKMIGSGTRCSPVGKQICINNRINECGESGGYSEIKDCKNLKCIEKGEKAFCEERGIETCIDCWNWLGNLIKPGTCNIATVYEFRLGHIFHLQGGPLIFSISQKSFCPIMIVGILIVGVLIILIIITFLKKRKIIFRGRRR